MRANSLETFFKILDWIFPAYFLIYFIEFYFGLWRLSSIVKLVIILLTLFYAGRIIRTARNNTDFFKLYSFYFLYCIFSCIWYVVNDVPFACYLNELFNSLAAMIFVYVGMADKRGNGKFYENFANYCTIAMIVGIFLYVTTPGWYVARNLEIIENTAHITTQYSEDTMLSMMRFSGYFKDVYEADMYAMVGLSIALFLFFLREKKTNEMLIYLMIIVNFAAAILSQQRVAMASAAFTVLFYLFYGFVRKKSKQSVKIILRTVIIAAGLLTLVMVFMSDRYEQIQVLLQDRKEHMDVSEALGERSNQHETVWKNWTMPILGKGAGSGGSVAGSYRLPHVNDGGYLQILYEYGIVGFGIFAFLMLTTLLRGARKMKYYLTELVIISFVLAAMLGSNTLTLGYMVIIPFWYSVGRIWNNEHRRYVIENEIRI